MASKGTGKGGTSKGGNEVLVAAALAAIKLIQEPKVQDQIAQACAAAADGFKNMKERRAERREPDADLETDAPEGAGRSRMSSIKSPFGNKKMERRVQNLSENVNLLRGFVGPEAEYALAEVDSVVNRLQVAVVMAGNLPMGKRQRAHWEIDSVLDKLEKAVFASVME